MRWRKSQARVPVLPVIATNKSLLAPRLTLPCGSIRLVKGSSVLELDEKRDIVNGGSFSRSGISGGLHHSRPDGLERAAERRDDGSFRNAG
jgi:hypothetical protein